MIYILLGILGLLALFLVFLFWNKPTLLIYGVIGFCFVNDLFVSFLHIPESIRYIADLLSVYLLVAGIAMMLLKPFKLYAAVPLTLIGILVLVALLSFCLNEYSVISFGIGTFQFFRGFCFFIACICVLQKEDVERLTKIFIGAAFANFLVSLFEYFVVHAEWDNNGGLFGIIVGCNGKMNLYLMIVTAIVVVFYLRKKMSTLLAVSVLGCCLVTATIAELKIYYLELMLCVVLVVLLSKPSKKMIFLVVCGGAAIWIAISILGVLYPLFADFFSIETMMEYSTGDYGNARGSVNRLSGISIMLSEYLNLPREKIFGIGLGNGHVGTAFYNQYEYLKYTYFYTTYVVTEMGIVGLVGLILFFVANAVVSFRYSIQNRENSIYCLVATIISILSIVLMIYDSSLITVTSYLLYFWLAVPYILKKQPRLR